MQGYMSSGLMSMQEELCLTPSKKKKTLHGFASYEDLLALSSCKYIGLKILLLAGCEDTCL